MHARKGQKYPYAKYETVGEAKTRSCELHEADYSQLADYVAFPMAKKKKKQVNFCPHGGEKRTTLSNFADLLHNFCFVLFCFPQRNLLFSDMRHFYNTLQKQKESSPKT